MIKPELLAPANNSEVLKTALRYGADAVYIGGEALSLRAGAKNASNAELKDDIQFAHSLGKKVYVAANIIAHNADIQEAEDYFASFCDTKPDAFIVSDPGMIRMAKRICPEVPIHLSTQANNCNTETFLFWYEQGIRRIVAARELSLVEIAEIRKAIPKDMEIEAFVHGAMCISYSGRCLLSSFLAGRDANHGECTHPCRWRYQVTEETRPGEYMPVFENERGTFLFHSKDLLMIDHIPELVRSGVSSLKIEGRMKTALYVASVTRAYREAIDDFFENPDEYTRKLPHYFEEVSHCTHRNYTTGFYFGKPTEDAQTYEGNPYENGAVYMGTVESAESGEALFTQKNKFSVGDRLEIMKPDGTNVETEVLSIRNDEGESMSSAPHASEKLHVCFSVLPEPGDVLRKKVPVGEQGNED